MNKISKFFLLTSTLLSSAPLMAGDNPIENDGLLTRFNNPTQILSIQTDNRLFAPSQIESETLIYLANTIDAFSPEYLAEMKRAIQIDPMYEKTEIYFERCEILKGLKKFSEEATNIKDGESSWIQLMEYIDHLHAFKLKNAGHLEAGSLKTTGPNIVNVDRTIIATINIFEKNIEYTSRFLLKHTENHQAQINTFPEAIKSILLSIQEEVQRTVQSCILDQVDNHQGYQDRLGDISWSLAKASKTAFKSSNKTLNEIIKLIDNIITSSV